MKYILLLCLLTLVSCGEGYEVREPYNKEGYFKCVHQTGLFHANIEEKLCKTLEECNDYCELKRAQLK